MGTGRIRRCPYLGVLLVKQLELIAVVALAACSGGTPLQTVTQAEARAPAHWGVCPPEAHGIGSSLSGVLADSEWIELPNAEAAKGLKDAIAHEDDENSLRIAVSGSIIRSGSSKPSTIDLAETIVDPVREAVARGADLLIGFPPGATEFLAGPP